MAQRWTKNSFFFLLPLAKKSWNFQSLSNYKEELTNGKWTLWVEANTYSSLWNISLIFHKHVRRVWGPYANPIICVGVFLCLQSLADFQLVVCFPSKLLLRLHIGRDHFTSSWTKVAWLISLFSKVIIKTLKASFSSSLIAPFLRLVLYTFFTSAHSLSDGPQG